MPTTHDNQRRHPRFSVHRPLNVIDSNRDLMLGRLVNVSEEGLMMLGSETVSDGGIFQVNIVVSHEGDASDVIHMGIECLWANEADSEKKIWSGFRIIDISETDQILLSALIDQLA